MGIPGTHRCVERKLLIEMRNYSIIMNLYLNMKTIQTIPHRNLHGILDYYLENEFILTLELKT